MRLLPSIVRRVARHCSFALLVLALLNSVTGNFRPALDLLWTGEVPTQVSISTGGQSLFDDFDLGDEGEESEQITEVLFDPLVVDDHGQHVAHALAVPAMPLLRARFAHETGDIQRLHAETLRPPIA